MKRFTHYVGLGDSISIDLYPSLDATGREKAPLGAVSLLGRKLRADDPSLVVINKTVDGAKTSDIRKYQLLELRGLQYENMLISLTAGGNDISFGIMEIPENERTEQRFGALLSKVIRDYVGLVNDVHDMFPNSTIVLNTLYDPTDGRGYLPDCGAWSEIAPLYSVGRRHLGDFIRNWNPGLWAITCDIFELFDGRGMRMSQAAARWYWSGFLIEPNAEGARQIANLWYNTVVDVRMDSIQELLPMNV